VIAGLRRLSAALTGAGRFHEAIAPLERVLAADTANAGELAGTLIPTLTSLADALLASGDQAALSIICSGSPR